MAKEASMLTVRSRRGAADDPTLPAILEFQWPSAAIANVPVPRSARRVAWIITSMVAALIAAAAIIPIDRVVTATGIVISRSPTLVVQPLNTAIIRSIDVHEGEQVTAGQVLARLDPTFATADLGALTARVTSLQAEVSRLQAEADGKPFKDTVGGPDWALQASIYAHRRAEFNLKLQNYEDKIRELTAVTARSRSDAAGYRDRLKIASTIEQMRKKLQALRVGSQLNTLVALDNRAEMARALANAEQSADAAERDRSAMEAERNGFIQSWKADTSQQLSKATRLLSDAREDLKKAKLVKQLVELRAEHAGTVLSVAKVSVGSVVQSGQQLFTLVPADAQLEVEANISGHGSGFVQVGDPAAIKFDTFPFTQYGMASGTVRTISPSSFSPQNQPPNPTGSAPVAAEPVPTSQYEPFYRARITLAQVNLHNVPPDFHLIPGMPVTTDIKVGKRTVLSYLLGRIMTVAHEGMREP